MKSELYYFRVIFVALVLLVSLSISASAQKGKVPQQISGGVLNGKALSLPKPEYPADARTSKIGGTVKVQVLIDENGTVVSARTISGFENVSLRVAAENAALRATFSPTRLNGKPVKVSGVVVYNFVAEKRNEERLKVLGVSAFLTITRLFSSDLDKFKVIFDEEELFKNEIEQYPEFAAEFKTLQLLEKTSIGNRYDAIDKALLSIYSRLDESEKWQYEAGKNLGEMMGSLMWSMASGDGEFDLEKIDDAGIKLNLNRIRDLILSVPPDFPRDVLQRLNALADFGLEDKLRSPEAFKDFFRKIEAFIDVISPGSIQ
jgi:TonB family protein